MIGLLGLIPGSRLVQGLVVAAVVAATVGAIGYGVHSYKEGLRDEGRKEVQAKWDAAEALRTEAALKASEAARVKENASRLSLQRIQNALTKEKEARAVAVVAVADGLRNLEAALANNRGPSGDTPTPAGVDDPRDGIISQCAATLGVLDAGVKRLASEKSALQAFARDVCLIQ